MHIRLVKLNTAQHGFHKLLIMQHIFNNFSTTERPFRVMILTLHVSKDFCAGLQSVHLSSLNSVQNLRSPDAELPTGREQQTTATRMCQTPSTAFHTHTHNYTHTAHSHSMPTAVMKHKTLNCVPIIQTVNVCKNDNTLHSPHKTIQFRCEAK